MALKKWDSGLIARRIRDLYRQGQDVSYNAMARANQGLISSANYYYGSYRKAVEAAGIDYAEICQKPRWNPDRVVDVILQGHRAGFDLSWAIVSKRRDELGCAAKAAIRLRGFGNWNDALRKAGLDPDAVSRYRHWPPRAIIGELKRRAAAGEPLNSKAIQAELPGLYGAAVRQLGSYDNALRKAGVNPKTIAQRRQWDQSAVCARLREFERDHGQVSQVMLRQHDSGLMRAIRIWFGDLPKAIAAAGVKRYSVRGHRVAPAKPVCRPKAERCKRQIQSRAAKASQPKRKPNSAMAAAKGGSGRYSRY